MKFIVFVRDVRLLVELTDLQSSKRGNLIECRAVSRVPAMVLSFQIFAHLHNRYSWRDRAHLARVKGHEQRNVMNVPQYRDD